MASKQPNLLPESSTFIHIFTYWHQKQVESSHCHFNPLPGHRKDEFFDLEMGCEFGKHLSASPALHFALPKAPQKYSWVGVKEICQHDSTLCLRTFMAAGTFSFTGIKQFKTDNSTHD